MRAALCAIGVATTFSLPQIAMADTMDLPHSPPSKPKERQMTRA